MKNYTTSTYRALIVLFFLGQTIFNISAQDRLADALGSVHDVRIQADRLKVSQAQVATKPVIKAKLDAINSQISSKKLSFQVAYTPAMDRTKAQLAGTKRPYNVNASAIKQQDDMNERIITKAQAEMQRDKVAVPDVAVSGKQHASRRRNVPASYFSGLKLLPEIKDQGTCGSCWSFAACATYETAFRKFYGMSRTVNMSEQDIVNCGKAADGTDAGSCSGGYSDYAFDYIRSFGATTESKVPYTGTDGECANTPKNFRAYSWGQVYPNDNFPSVEDVKQYIYTYGAVVTYMKAGIETFYGYKSGVYNDSPSEDPNDVDHAVVLVGWDDLSKAWIVRNSWGKDWGYTGYAYVSYNACNIGKWVYWIYPKYTRMSVSGGLPSGTVAVEEPVEPSPILRAHRQ
jgi:C1A family cysteine protease